MKPEAITDLKSVGESRAGSSPAEGTIYKIEMTEQEAKHIIKQYWNLVKKAKQKLAGSVISEDKCDWTGGYKINSIDGLFLYADGSIGATVLPFAPDEELYIAVPANAFEEL